MRNYTTKEMKKIYDDLQRELDNQIKKQYMQQISSAAVPTAYWGRSPAYPKISPTDKDAKGMFPYLEPEVDEQGTFYGYKILHKCRDRMCQKHGWLVSPRYQAHWGEDGQLTANLVPNEKSMHGIHCTKRPDHPELENYYGSFHGSVYSRVYDEGTSVLVKCALSGTIVETEQGFRAEHAQIVEVFENGNWKSYSDYQERTRAYSDRNRQEEWEEKRWRLAYGAWDSSPIAGIDTSADS